MNETDRLLHDANRAAHRGMRVLVNALEEDARYAQRNFTMSVRYRHPELAKAAREYEEANRRAQQEATA